MILFILILPVFFCLYSYYLTHVQFQLMLIWNYLLALVPMLMIYLMKKKNNKVLNVVYAFIFIIFVPNTYYLITDLMHLESINFQMPGAMNPAQLTTGLSEWSQFFSIAIMGIYGFCIGGILLNKFMDKFKINNQAVSVLLSIIIGLGIYIGRFLRLNSWDLINPIYVINTVINSINSFTIYFIVCLSLIIYLSIHFNKKIN